MRDILILGLTLLMLLYAVRSAFNATLLWGWSGLMSLDSYAYGFMRDFPWGTTFAIIALLLLLQQSSRLTYKSGSAAFAIIFGLVALHALAVGVFAYSGISRNAEIAEKIIKIVLYCLILPAVLTNRYRVYAFLWLIAIAVGFHTALDGIKFVASGGHHIVRGLAKYGDNNHIAVITVMLIPIMLHLRSVSGSFVVRLVALGLVGVFFLSVVATNSRGGLISLAAYMVWQVAVSKRKLVGGLTLAVVAVTLVAFAPERWETRMNTISDANEDSSFMGRVAAWQTSSAVALQHPVFGGGFHAIESGRIWYKYRSEPGLLGFIDIPVFDGVGTGGKAAHSIYFEVLGDQGFVGFAIFISVLVLGFRCCRALKRFAPVAQRPAHWSFGLGTAISGSLMVFMVGGAGVSIAYFELPYYLIATVCVALRLARDGDGLKFDAELALTKNV